MRRLASLLGREARLGGEPSVGVVVAARPAETRVGRDQPGDELALRIRERGLIDRPLAQLVQVQRVVVQGSDAVMTDPTTISLSASFDDAECIACSFANATLNKVAFKGAYLPGAQLSSVMTLQNASFGFRCLHIPK